MTKDKGTSWRIAIVPLYLKESSWCLVLNSLMEKPIVFPAPSTELELLRLFKKVRR